MQPVGARLHHLCYQQIAPYGRHTGTPDFSSEFRQRYGDVDNAGFVDLVYKNVMKRSPDRAGSDYWNGELSRGLRRGDLMTAFSESEEYRRKSRPTIDDVNGNGAIARLYLAFFERRPDDSGLEYFLSGGYTARQVADIFAASDEFRRRYGTLTDSQFIDLVYENVLGRPADRDGRSFWLGRLADGASRGELMLAFSESDEFVKVTGTIR